MADRELRSKSVAQTARRNRPARRVVAAAGIVASAVLAMAAGMFLTLSAWDRGREVASGPLLAGVRADGQMPSADGGDGVVRLTR